MQYTEVFVIKVARLKVSNPINSNWIVFSEVVRDLDYVGWKVKNRTVTRYYDLLTKELQYNRENEKRMTSQMRKEHFGYSSYENLIYDEFKNDYSDYNFYSSILQELIRDAIQTFKKVERDVLSGKNVLPIFKKGQPIPLRSRQIKVVDKETIKLSLLNKEGGISKDLPGSGRSFPFEVKIYSNNKYVSNILNNVMNGSFLIRDSSLIKKGKDVYISLSYKDLREQQIGIT